ncbi:MAG TPA: hypothetical protein VF898_12025 [Chloroflexota bacterium]
MSAAALAPSGRFGDNTFGAGFDQYKIRFEELRGDRGRGSRFGRHL